MLRTSRLARAIRPIRRHTSQYRLLSSDSHNEHHEYRKEDFTSSFWRNSILFSALVVAFYKFAPTPSQDVYLTRWLAKLSTPLDVWENINAKHLHLAQQLSADTLLTSDARMSTVHRYRYPQSFDQVSPHLSPIGGVVDLQGLSVKGDKD